MLGSTYFRMWLFRLLHHWRNSLFSKNWFFYNGCLCWWCEAYFSTIGVGSLWLSPAYDHLFVKEVPLDFLWYSFHSQICMICPTTPYQWLYKWSSTSFGGTCSTKLLCWSLLDVQYSSSMSKIAWATLYTFNQPMCFCGSFFKTSHRGHLCQVIESCWHWRYGAFGEFAHYMA